MARKFLNFHAWQHKSMFQYPSIHFICILIDTQCCHCGKYLCNTITCLHQLYFETWGHLRMDTHNYMTNIPHKDECTQLHDQYTSQEDEIKMFTST